MGDYEIICNLIIDHITNSGFPVPLPMARNLISTELQSDMTLVGQSLIQIFLRHEVFILINHADCRIELSIRSTFSVGFATRVIKITLQ